MAKNSKPNAKSQRQVTYQAALPVAIVVRQSRRSRRDRALFRALSQLWPDPRRDHGRQADHRHRADRLRPLPLQPSPPGLGEARARRHPHGRRHRVRISDASDPGDRQTADRGARPEPRLSRAGRGAARLSDRRRGADHRLRQDHARRHHGGGDRQHPGHRPLRRADAERLVEGQAGRLRHHQMGDGQAPCGRRDRLRRIRRTRSPRRRLRSATATPWAPPRP